MVRPATGRSDRTPVDVVGRGGNPPTSVCAAPVAPGATGVMTLRGRLAARDAAMKILGGDALGAVKLIAKGEIDTPYGSVRMPVVGR